MDGPSAISAITGLIDTVSRERAARRQDPALGCVAQAVRRYQAARFRSTYADLLAHPSTRNAALFFLNELYGEQDFLERDAQFRRIVPALVRLFPGEVVNTVHQLAELHALSEQLDSRMAAALISAGQATAGDAMPLQAGEYGVAWRQVGEPAQRERQIELVGLVGHSLLRYTTHPSLGRALRLMRLPARAAGLSALQAFLERGFDTFGALPDAPLFIRTVTGRERELARLLFADSTG
ncbi:MAG: hypothetical protein JNJ71_10155 [Rubrivivax sp.]|nr:hypothetical protein [Rubrivivax sp.]